VIPIKFPEANCVFRPPPDLEESQCHSVPAFSGQIIGGSCDGLKCVVVAWKPSVDELEALKNGQPIFLTMIGGLAPHFLSLSFEQSTHAA
jgi:hypothetical protein